MKMRPSAQTHGSCVRRVVGVVFASGGGSLCNNYWCVKEPTRLIHSLFFSRKIQEMPFSLACSLQGPGKPHAALHNAPRRKGTRTYQLSLRQRSPRRHASPGRERLLTEITANPALSDHRQPDTQIHQPAHCSTTI